MSADPAGPVDGFNLYVYVSGNPVRKNDPRGTDEWDMTDPEPTKPTTEKKAPPKFSVPEDVQGDYIDNVGISEVSSSLSSDKITFTTQDGRRVDVDKSHFDYENDPYYLTGDVYESYDDAKAAVDRIPEEISAAAGGKPAALYRTENGIILPTTISINTARRVMAVVGVLQDSTDQMLHVASGTIAETYVAISGTRLPLKVKPFVAAQGAVVNATVPAKNIGGITAEQAGRLKELLMKIPGAKSVFAFGSRTKGTWKAGSDLDIALFGKINARSKAAKDAVKAAQEYASEIGIGTGKGYRPLDVNVYRNVGEMKAAFRRNPAFDPTKMPKLKPLK